MPPVAEACAGPLWPSLGLLASAVPTRSVHSPLTHVGRIRPLQPWRRRAPPRPHGLAEEVEVVPSSARRSSARCGRGRSAPGSRSSRRSSRRGRSSSTGPELFRVVVQAKVDLAAVRPTHRFAT
eukprot:16442080-Heterocapsa_arctica.AAC.1